MSRIAIALVAFLAPALLSQESTTKPTSQQIRAAAFDVMQAARYASLVTNGEGGHPQARVVDPLIGSDNSIWIATNPLTRKVQEILHVPLGVR